MSGDERGYMSDPDTALMAAFAAGDDAAFEKVVESCHRQVYSTAMRFTANPASAEDITQEVFLKLFRYRNTYRPTARLSTLIYRITTNLCLNYIRDDRRRRALSLDDTAGEGDAPISALLEDESAVGAPQRAEAGEKARIVRGALDAIPPRQRLALVLHRFEGLSYAGIAEAMETSVPGVKSLLNRARASLADALKRDVEAGNL